MKKKSIITLCFVVVCAILLNYVAFIGFNIAGFSYGGMFGETGIKKGIDLAGGSVITFQADSDAPTDDQMQVVESIFQTRMTNARCFLNVDYYFYIFYFIIICIVRCKYRRKFLIIPCI